MDKERATSERPLWSDTEGVPLVPAQSHRAPADGDGRQSPPPPPPPDASDGPPPPPAADGPASGGAPRLAEGIDLIGEYEDSGYKEPHYIARRADGQVIQLSELLYLVAEECDGNKDHGAIAAAVSERFDKKVSADNVATLVEKLQKLGVLASPDGSSPDVAKADPLLALKFKAKVIPKGVTKAITVLFHPLFWPPVVVAVVAGFIAVDVWLFGIHGVAQSLREMIYQPHLLLMVLGAVVVATAFHECGHATACAYGGAEPGVMGAGIYVVWPAFYTDVTDAYRLGRGGRLRTDLGGVYFNAIFALVTFGIYLATRFEPILLLVLLQNFVIIQQMLPLLRMDGYYILADLTGIPDLFMRIRPVLASLIPWRKTDERVKELKPWVRVVVTMWVFILIPFLIYIFGTILISAPRIFATAWDSFGNLRGEASEAFGSGNTTKGVARSAQIGALALPLAGIVLTFARTGKRIVSGMWHWTEGRPLGRLAVALVVLAAIAAGGLALGPDGDYRPIGPDDRGTFGDSIETFEEVPNRVRGAASGDYEPAPAPSESPEPAESERVTEYEETDEETEEEAATPQPTASSS